MSRDQAVKDRERATSTATDAPPPPSAAAVVQKRIWTLRLTGEGLSGGTFNDVEVPEGGQLLGVRFDRSVPAIVFLADRDAPTRKACYFVTSGRGPLALYDQANDRPLDVSQFLGFAQENAESPPHYVFEVAKREDRK